MGLGTKAYFWPWLTCFLNFRQECSISCLAETLEVQHFLFRTKGRLRVMQGKLTSLPNVDHWLYLSVDFFSVYLIVWSTHKTKTRSLQFF